MVALPQSDTAAPALSDEACWQAALQKRRSADGLFYTAVLTTGIYCRPSCPSRMPLRQNVRFFPTADAAEAAGFRACKRCRPREPMRSDAQLVRDICRRLERADEPPTLAQLSVEFGVSRFHLQRTFKKVTGLSPKAYASSHRAVRLRRALRDGQRATEAAFAAGFASTSRAYASADDLLGMTPGRYGRGGEGMALAFTVATSSFGRMLVAATERGVSTLIFGDDDNRLETDLRAEFPRASVTRDDAGMRRWVEAVLASVDAGLEQPQLPLDIRATAFRARVWAELRRIPRGETRTYGEVARAIGAPGAARAVGNACNANPVPVIVPCHRVVAGDGTLGGFRYGLDRKRELLSRERR
jgi:AraC family transcriptional regulator of adaptative response/methylated-DNA-[protein]-cysteine methyltransferase